jgi:predicted DNA-binding transcriptional regulator YafY
LPISVRFKVAGITEIKRWLLGFGAKAKVLEPANLREEISNEASDVAPIRLKEPTRVQYQLKLK